MFLMGIDMGTTSAKAVITDINGRVIAQSSSSYDVMTPKNSWAEQWPDVWIDGSVKAIKNCIGIFNEENPDRTRKIIAIAVSGLYGGSGIPVDLQMSPVRPCMIWMDRRARRETEWVKSNVDRKLLMDITGNYVDSYYGFTKMMWLKNNEPENWEKTYKFITPKDYLIYKMTGIESTDYSSAGNIGGVFDIHKKEWSEETVKALGLSVEKLPDKIIKSTDVAGRIEKEFAAVTGLHEGTPVISGGIDAPVAQLSGGAVNRKEHVAMVGTSMCWGFLHGGDHVSPGLVSFPYIIDGEDTIYTFGGGATSGAVPDWFAKQFENEYSDKKIEFEKLGKEAAGISPGSEGLLVLPYFMGERSPIWNPDARGTIFGLSLNHGKGHIFRAMLESIAYSLRHNMEFAKESGVQLEPVCSIVGGAAKSDLWISIFADITGYSFRKTSGNIEAPLGDAFLAGLGSGIINDANEIKNWIAYEETVQPDETSKKTYEEMYYLYKKLYENTKDIMKELSEKYS